MIFIIGILYLEVLAKWFLEYRNIHNFVFQVAQPVLKKAKKAPVPVKPVDEEESSEEEDDSEEEQVRRT